MLWFFVPLTTFFPLCSFLVALYPFYQSSLMFIPITRRFGHVKRDTWRWPSIPLCYVHRAANWYRLEVPANLSILGNYSLSFASFSIKFGSVHTIVGISSSTYRLRMSVHSRFATVVIARFCQTRCNCLGTVQEIDYCYCYCYYYVCILIDAPV